MEKRKIIKKISHTHEFDMSSTVVPPTDISEVRTSYIWLVAFFQVDGVIPFFFPSKVMVIHYQ